MLCLPKKRLVNLLSASVFAYISVVTLAYSMYLLPFAQAQVLSHTMPIFASIISYLFKNVELGNFEGITIVCNLVGVLIMAYPQCIFNHEHKEEDCEWGRSYDLGIVFAIISSVAAAISS